MPGPGQYPHRATFEAHKEDSEGRLKWRQVSSRFVAKEDTGGIFQEAASNLKQFAKIRTRLMATVDVEMRIKLGGRSYEIISIKHDREKQETELTCSTSAAADAKL